MTTTGPQDEAHTIVLTGYLLRSFLLLTLRQAGSVLAVADLVAGLEREGYVTRGRPSKAVSDALRWEVARGRVRRLARGVYVVGHLPRQTAWRMRRRLADHVAPQRCG